MTTGEIQSGGTRVVQVTNVAKTATHEQLKTFFEFIGVIEELKVYPSQDLTSFGSKVCYVKYEDEASVQLAQHLTNVVFIDQALIVVPLGDGIIPEEHQALQVVTVNFGGGLMYQGIPGIVQTVIGSVTPVVRMQLTCPQPPPLPDVDPAKFDETRRTVHISHLPKDISAEQLMSFFSACGDIRYVRIIGDEEESTTRYAFIEFVEASCVGKALQYNGALFGGVPLKVDYSKHAIVKPEKEIARTKTVLDKTMKKVTEASKLVSEELDDDNTKSRKSSRSRSPSRSRRSRSQSPSRSRRRRSHSRSRDHYTRPARRRSPSRERYRGARRVSRSRSRDRKRRRSTSRGRSKDRVKRRSKERSRDRSPDRGKIRSKESSRKKSEKKEEPKSPPEKKKEDEEEKRSDKEEEENRESKGKETSKKKAEKPKEKAEKPKEKSRSRSPSKSRQREKKRSRDKSHSRSPSKSPRRSSSKHKKKKERRDKGPTRRGSDDEYEGKKHTRESGEDDQEERPKQNRSDESGDDRKKSRRRRSDDGNSEPEDSKKKRRHYKKKPISADHYESGSE